MNNITLYIIMLLVGALTTYIVMPFFRKMLISNNVVRPNYKKDMIPVSMGLVFLPTIIINSIILIFFTRDVDNLIYTFMYLFGLISMCLVGVLDDIVGNRDVSGLKGHFKSLFNGTLTTGGFKALFGGFVGILISVTISNSLVDICINTLIIALSTNLMNLLDLRPGRAIKVYLLIAFSILYTISGYNKALILILLPSVIIYFEEDLKAKAMMGDTGSNVLGIAIGILFAISYTRPIRVCWLIFLVIIHLITEKYSLTKIIENNKVLNFIDKLGR